MAKQVSLTRKHKTALVDLFQGSTSVDDLDLQVKIELIAAGLIDYGVLTKEGTVKAQELLAKVKNETKT